MIDLAHNPDLKSLAVCAGSVFRMTFTPRHGIVPKNPGDSSRDKYFVILGVSNDALLVGSLIINTEINVNLAPRIFPFQLKLKASRYDFLEGKDRYLDCYRIFPIEFEEVVNNAQYVGMIEDNDL